MLNSQLSKGNHTFYFAIDNNADKVPDATWLDYVQLNIIDNIFPCNTNIPIANITIDGLANDWQGINPFIQDAQNDSTCGQGTDIKDVYLATDGLNLFWRIDTASGTFDFENYKDSIGIQFYTQSGDYFNSSAIWKGTAGRIRTYDKSFTEYIFTPTQAIGTDYGIANKIAEGKIPLSFFAGKTFTSLSAFFYSPSASTGWCDSARSSTCNNY